MRRRFDAAGEKGVGFQLSPPRDQRQWAADHPAPPAALRRALRFWTRLHGILSLELAGHFTGMGLDPAELYESELRHLTL